MIRWQLWTHSLSHNTKSECIILLNIHLHKYMALQVKWMVRLGDQTIIQNMKISVHSNTLTSALTIMYLTFPIKATCLGNLRLNRCCWHHGPSTTWWNGWSSSESRGHNVTISCPFYHCPLGLCSNRWPQITLRYVTEVKVGFHFVNSECEFLWFFSDAVKHHSMICAKTPIKGSNNGPSSYQ